MNPILNGSAHPGMAQRLTRFAQRRAGFCAAIAALVATAALAALPGGHAVPDVTLIASLFGAPMLAGLSGVAATGLVAWLIASLSIQPLAPPARAALAASLTALLLFPGGNITALAVPVALAPALAAEAAPGNRTVAIMVQCGAILALAVGGADMPTLGYLAVTILGYAGFEAFRGSSGAANDNPSLERTGHDSSVPAGFCYASMHIGSIPGKRE